MMKINDVIVIFCFQLRNDFVKRFFYYKKTIDVWIVFYNIQEILSRQVMQFNIF